MPRRSTRAKQPDPVVDEDEHMQEEEQAPEPEPEPVSEAEPNAEAADNDGNEDEDEDEDEDMEQRALEFDEELSWRPAKPIPSATLLDRLERLSKELADFDQGAVRLDSLKDVSASLAHRNLLQHKDRGVKAYTACCLVDILRLFVPDAPFADDQLKVRIAQSCRAPCPCP
jgi:sister-chromatid-cohesion protein PDS5